MTKHEWLIRNVALKWNKTGYRFLRQKVIWPFILDYYCSKLKLGIEIDWSSHDEKQEYDLEREEYLRNRGIQIIRYTNSEVEQNLAAVIEDIKSCMKERSLSL